MGKNQGKDNEMDILVGVSYRPLNLNEERDAIFYKQLGEAPPWTTTIYEISAEYRYTVQYSREVQQRRNSLRSSWSAWKITS